MSDEVVTVYKYEAHRFQGIICGKAYCIDCGLVYLGNRFTEWNVKVGCYNYLHPQYSSKRKQLSNKENAK